MRSIRSTDDDGRVTTFFGEFRKGETATRTSGLGPVRISI